MLYIILWYIAGFISWIVAVKVNSGEVTVGDLLMAILIGLGGLLITGLMALRFMHDTGILRKRIW
jgi:uncharacterized membrane protein (DUF485 family)